MQNNCPGTVETVIVRTCIEIGHKIISGHDTIFYFHVKPDIFGFCFFINFCRLTCMSKTASLNMFPTKYQRQNDRIGCPVIACVRRNLDVSMGFITKILIFQLRPLFRLLCLINSFQRRYVPCMYNKCPIHRIYLQYTRYIQ